MNQYMQIVFDKIITSDNLSNFCSGKYSYEACCCSHKFIFTGENALERAKILEEMTLDYCFDNLKKLETNMMIVLQELCLRENTIETKLNILNKFLNFVSTENLMKAVELGGKIITPDFLLIIESLLTKSCSIIFNIYRSSGSTTQDHPELKVLNPLLRFLLTSNKNFPNVTSSILEQSDIVNHLMMFLSFTATKIFNETAHIAKLTYKNNVFGKMEKLNYDVGRQLFKKCFGFTIMDENVQIQAYLLNINDELIEGNKLKFDGENTEKIISTNSMETMQIIVMDVLSCQHLLVYITDRWNEILHQMSKIIETAEQNGKQNGYCRVGDIVGFRNINVKFERITPQNVKFLRGQVLAVTSDCVMLWALDIGLICYSSIQFIIQIYSIEIVSQPALMKICEIKNSVHDFDTDTFLNASNLLLSISKSKFLQVKQMLLSGCGIHFFAFMKYPRYSVRLTIMNILLCLADSCKHVVKFMEKHHFHTFLSDKLECYAFAYRSKMYCSEADFSVEITTMIKLLTLILEEVLLFKWSGRHQAVRALKILFNTPGSQWRSLVTRSLHLLGENPKEVVRCSLKEIDEVGCHPTFLKNTLLKQSKYEDVSKIQKQELVIEEAGEKGSADSHHIISGRDYYYIFGSKVNVVQDQTHELMKQQKLNDIKESELSEVLCGLMNNNVKSSLYFGISRDSIVTGIVLFRETKDIFRNGVDRIMSKCLLPEVKAICYDVIFSPILNCQDKLTDISQKHLYVIEICVRPLMHIAYVVHQGRHCFMRKGGHTFETTVLQKKNYMMEVEEAVINDNIRHMDLESLVYYVQDYICQQTSSCN